MKLAIDEAVEIEFDDWSLKEAQRHLDEIRRKYRHNQTGEPDHGRFDSVVKGMFTLLFFGQLEKQQPGVTKRMMDQASSLASAMTKPKPESSS